MAKKKLDKQKEPFRPSRQLNHNALPLKTKGVSFLQSAILYFQEHAKFYALKEDSVKKMALQLEGKLSSEKSSFRLETQKDFMDTITLIFVQTYFGLPVWEAGLAVTINKKRNQILSSLSTAYDKIEILNFTKPILSKKFTSLNFQKMVGLEKVAKSKQNGFEIHSERPLIYKFKSEKRTIIPVRQKQTNKNEGEFVLPLPLVPEDIKENNFYIVKEIIFNYPLPGIPKLVWRAFVEPKTGSVLYLRAFASNATAMVFERDPITKGTGLTPSDSNAALTIIRDTVTLGNLVPPVSGVQSLRGSLVSIDEVENPVITSPTEITPYNFNYNARTNDFAAANTYYHCDGFFQLILDLGFSMAYFNGTSFPVPCDHRGLGGTGNTINAHCLGNTTGIISVDFALADTSDVANPMGIAADQRVVIHEIGGHGILYCHVGSANFGFAHSAGDSIAAIFNDPKSLAPDRFETFPFTFLSLPASARRRHDRTPASGWGWSGNIGLNPFNGSLDYAGYNNEQILSTTLFRLYRSLGGDSNNVNKQHFASRSTIYLILKAISTLSTSTNPANALEFEQAMENGDASDWVSFNPSETHAGGAYMKVIRWAFEKQGLFQIPGTSTPNNSIGDAPPVDVYINDGRNGEYDYLHSHWSCQDIWNRVDTLSGDGGGIHQEPIIGQTNYAFVRIKNRGYQSATGITVKGFHCLPGVGLVYPNDWTPMTTVQLPAPNLTANDNTGIVVGPFSWIHHN